MILLVLTAVLGCDWKTAVETSVFVMAFTAFAGAISRFAIGGAPDMRPLVFCVFPTLLWARVAAKIANKSEGQTLHRVAGIVLVIRHAVVLGVHLGSFQRCQTPTDIYCPAEFV